MTEIQIHKNALDMHSVCLETDIRPYGLSSSFLKASGRFVCVCVCVCVWLDSSTDDAVLVSIFIADINVNKCRGLN